MSNLQTHIEREARERMAAQLATATEVRTAFGWWAVEEVNADSVTVDGPFYLFRIPYAAIIEVR